MRQIILISVKVPSDAAGGIFGVLNKRRGVPIGSEQTAGTPMEVVKAYLPVNESFGKFVCHRLMYCLFLLAMLYTSTVLVNQ